MDKRDDADDDRREDEDEDEAADSEDSAAEARAEKARKERARKPRREAKAVRVSEPQRKSPPASSGGQSRAVIVAVVALAAGLAAGWFAHDARAKSKLQSESSPATAGSSGPCQSWEKQICKSSGDESATCQQAKGAAELLTPSTCETALATVPATLAKVKAARASCDNLVSKVCADLPKGSSTCKMVVEKTKSFPTERCKELLEHYAEVLGELKQIDAQGGPEMMMQGMPPGMPQGMPPGMPQGMPPGMPQGMPPDAP